MEKIYRTHLINEFINSNNLTDLAFCKLVGISKDMLKRVINQDENVTIEDLTKIVKVLKIKLLDIFY